jgi:hypothetical protein
VHTPDEAVPAAPHVGELAARGVEVDRVDLSSREWTWGSAAAMLAA